MPGFGRLSACHGSAISALRQLTYNILYSDMCSLGLQDSYYIYIYIYILIYIYNKLGLQDSYYIYIYINIYIYIYTIRILQTQTAHVRIIYIYIHIETTWASCCHTQATRELLGVLKQIRNPRLENQTSVSLCML